ncbi:hypothetical protein [Streptomyces chartreusis]|uniref:hypothetical protein n=1 Tax=Streptomyces chartreusis TaxID=1969 RepID=UPI0036D04249
MREQDAWLVFEDGPGAASAQGLHLVPDRSAAAGQRVGEGIGATLGRGIVCAQPGERIRLIYRMLVHYPGRRGENGFRERDFAELLEAADQQLGGRIVLVWNNSTQHRRDRSHLHTAMTSPPSETSVVLITKAMPAAR